MAPSPEHKAIKAGTGLLSDVVGIVDDYANFPRLVGLNPVRLLRPEAKMPGWMYDLARTQAHCRKFKKERPNSTVHPLAVVPYKMKP